MNLTASEQALFDNRLSSTMKPDCTKHDFNSRMQACNAHYQTVSGINESRIAAQKKRAAQEQLLHSNIFNTTPKPREVTVRLLF